MLKFKTRKRFSGIMILGSLLLLAFSSQFPTGRTGAPGDSTCSACHGNPGNFTGQINISGLPSSVDGNDILTITTEVEVLTGNPTRAGFSMVALEDSGDTNAGDFLSGDGAFSNSGGREYWGHSPAQNFGGGSTVDWEADWEAPNITDDVTFYVCSVLANGSGNSGDNVICTSETISVTAVSSVTVDIDNVTDVTCNGGSDGSAEAIPSMGTPPYEYEWDNGEDTAIAVELDAGNHSVTVTDDNGNTAEASVNIDEPNEIGVDASVQSVSCNGEEDGEISLGAFGGNGGYDYDWETLPSGNDQTDLEPGDYFLTVTDSEGCTAEFEFTIDEPQAIDININTTDVSMSGAADGTANATPSGGTAPYNYSWSNGATTQMITNLPPGQFCVTVTDNNGCEEMQCATVAGGACALMASSMIDQVACFGESSGMIGLALSGVTMPATFNWSDGSSNSSLSNVPAGTYAVTVNDAAGCNVMLSGLAITQPDSLDVQLQQLQNANCQNSTEGAIMVNVLGGTAGYDLVWSNGAINDTIINGLDTLINLPDTLVGLAPGLYSYALTDANGCVRNGFYEVTNLDNTPPTILLQEAIITLDANGNAPAATFDMIDAGTTDNCEISMVSFSTPPFTCADIGIQTFSVFVTDSNGNISTSQATLQIVETIAPIVNCSASNITVNTCGAVMYQIPTASDNCGGAVITSLQSGLASGSVFPTGMSTVVYQATDECNNVGTCSFVVNVINNLTASITTTPALCNANSGSITVTPSGGTPPYDVQPFGIFQDGLAAGNYNITISDSAGCSVEQVSTIDSADGPQVSVTTTPSGCDGDPEGNIVVQFMGGVPPYMITINGEPTMTINDPGSITRTGGGSYDITIVDSNGCAVTRQEIIAEPTSPNLTLTDLSVSCAGDMIFVDFSTQFPNLTFEGFPRNVGAGVVDVLVMDNATGCSAVNSFEVIEPEELLIAEVTRTNDDICTFTEDDITVQAQGGTPPYTITVTNQGADPVGPYDVVVTDDSGCRTTDIFTLQDFSMSALSLSIAETVVSCDGDVQISAVAAGGCGPFTFDFDDNQIFESGMDHTVSVIDSQGNTVEVTFTVEEIPNITLASELVTNITISGPGSIDIDAVGGSGVYNYTWTNAAGDILSVSEDLTDITEAGDYTLTISDQNGCLETFVFTVTGVSATVELDSDNSEVILSPNPTTDNVRLQFLNGLPSSLDIVNVNGELFFRTRVITITTDIESNTYPAGVYYIRLSYDDNVIVKQFVKI